jgi:acetolactate synthase-1/2/3 large subunit
MEYGLIQFIGEKYGLDDQKCGAVALPQQSFYGRDFAVDLVSRDWAKFAEALGGIGARAETAEEVRHAVETAIASGKPALAQVPVRSVPSPFLQAAGF